MGQRFMDLQTVTAQDENDDPASAWMDVEELDEVLHYNEITVTGGAAPTVDAVVEGRRSSSHATITLHTYPLIVASADRHQHINLKGVGQVRDRYPIGGTGMDVDITSYLGQKR